MLETLSIELIHNKTLQWTGGVLSALLCFVWKGLHLILPPNTTPAPLTMYMLKWLLSELLLIVFLIACILVLINKLTKRHGIVDSGITMNDLFGS